MTRATSDTPIRILHVEDNELDCELVAKLLQKAGIRSEVIRVETRAAYVKALKQGGIDLILSDHTLPSFDGLTALELARKHFPHIPYIFVSGTIGEQAAIDSMSQGATDYILKNNLSRLGPAVRRALADARERTRQRDVENQYRLITENAADYIAVLDLEGRRLYNSPSYRNLLGNPAKLRGTDSFQEIHPDDRERVRVIFRETVASGVGQRAVYRFLLKGGDVRYMESQGSVVRDAEGNPEKVIVVSRDISDRKNAEQSLLKLSSAVEQAGDCVVITNKDGIIEYVNPAFEKTTGHKRGFAVGKTPRILKSGKQDSAYYGRLWQTILSGKTFRDVVINKKANGDLFYEEQTITPIVDDRGAIMHFVSTGRDITERQRAQRELQESERRFREMLENVELIAMTLDKDANITFCNDYLLRLTGWQRDEVLGRSWFDLFIPPDITDVREVFTAVIQDRSEALHHENEILTRSGGRRLIHWNNSVLRSGSGEVIGAASIGEDVTDRKSAEDLQRALFRIAQAADGAQQLDDLFHAIHSIVKEIMTAENFYIALYDKETDLLSFPYFVDEVDQPSPTQKPGRGLTEYVLRTGKSLLCVEALHQRLVEAGEADLVGAPSPIWLGVPLKIEGNTIGVMVVQHYERAYAYGEREKVILEYISSQVARVIDRKRAEQALELAHGQLKNIFDNLDKVFFSLDVPNNKLLQISPACEDIYGYSPEAFLSNPGFWFEVIHPDDRGRVTEINESQVLKGTPAGWECRIVRPDGEIRWIETQAKPTNDVSGKPVRIDGIISDITKRKKADEELLESERRYRTLFEESKDGLFLSTPDGRLVDVNRATLNIFGYDSKEEALHLNLANDVYHEPRDREEFLRKLAEEGVVDEFEFIGKRKDGTRVNVILSATGVRDANGNLAIIRGLIRDVTKQRQLELQLIQAQKMESLGTLAGGIAHDFNNLLGIIMGHASLVESPRRDAGQRAKSIEAITQSAQRGAALVRQLLTFARKTDVTLESVMVNSIVLEVVKLLEETLPRIITIATRLEDKLPSIVADATQVHQVLLNLSVNARDAMLPRGGTLSLQTTLIPGDNVRVQFPGAGALEYVLLSVSDDGTGMDEATRMRIFDPFFTTKEKGKGTGLGLATVYGIVESHQGFIDVASEVGRGTTFRVYFPVLPRRIEVPEVQRDLIAEIPGGTETILLVEDEEMLRDLVVTVLEGKGYIVRTAGDGAEAISLYSRDHAGIALVLTDLGLPKLGGELLIKGLREINPSAKIIVASGHMDGDLRAQLLESGAREFINKPFRPNELLRKIRQALDERQENA